MTAKANHSTSATRCPSPLVLFGIDSRGKPKAARFGKNAATLAAAGNGNGSSPVRLTGSHAGGAATASPPSGNPNLPCSWDQIALGDLVVAQQGLEDGWYEAIVVEVNGDMLTLRWRDYPRERRVVRHRLRVGLLYPGPHTAAHASKQAKPVASAKQIGPTNKHESSLPADWKEIDINTLVLAKTEGPWANWFEAIPIESAGDGFKLRWRDYAACHRSSGRGSTWP